jgi:DNA processing protein
MNLGIVNTLTLKQLEFPAILAQIPQPPNQLFYLGAPPKSWLDHPKVAVVGSRKVSPYGRQVTELLSAELAVAGVVIISGMALGVDSLAHKATLDANGLTIAVLPTSLDNIYPASHLNLARQIIENGGTIFSEYPVGKEVYKQNFIIRNRLVSGLADILLITEAAVNSGSLHTARFALEQGKTVMVVPGNITSPTSEGCNNLIKSGAIPVTSAEDVLFALGFKVRKKRRRAFSGTEQEQKILDLIKEGIETQEEMALAAKLDSPAITSALTGLEISGFVRPTVTAVGAWLNNYICIYLMAVLH